MTAWVLTLFFLSAIQEILNIRLMLYFGIDWKSHKLHQHVYSAAQIAWILAGGLFHIPVPVLFAGVYFLQIFLLPTSGKNSKKIWCCRIMGCVLFSSSYLISYGMIDIYGFNAYRHMGALIGAKILMIIFCFLPWNKVIYQQRAKSEDDRRETLFLRILLCLLLYVFADGCLCLSSYQGIFVPLLLVTGNALLLILYLFLMRQEYLAAESQYLEEERRKLGVQTAVEEYKNKKHEVLAERDTLTGAYTRRIVIEKMQKMGSDWEPLSVVFIDLDGLKKINDEQGHEAGDKYLKNFVNELNNRIGPNDMTARIGGDEFLVLFPRCELKSAAEQMKLIRCELSKTGTIPFSFGVASGNDCVDSLIEMADKEMYIDKRRVKEESPC